MRRFAILALALSFMALGAGVAWAQKFHVGGFGSGAGGTGGAIGAIKLGSGLGQTGPVASSGGSGFSGDLAPAGIPAGGDPGGPGPTIPEPPVTAPRVGSPHVPASIGGQ